MLAGSRGSAWDGQAEAMFHTGDCGERVLFAHQLVQTPATINSHLSQGRTLYSRRGVVSSVRLGEGGRGGVTQDLVGGQAGVGADGIVVLLYGLLTLQIALVCNRTVGVARFKLEVTRGCLGC